MQAIELAEARRIVIEDRGRQYTLTVRPIPKKDWLEYFAGIVSTSENQDGKRVDSFDSSAARLDLVEKNLVDAQGYAGAAVTTIKDWQRQIPLAHRLAVGNALIGVEAAVAEDDAPIALGAETVYLNAIWSARDDGKMWKLSQLGHKFETPTAAHQRRYSRDASRSRIVGGSRNGKTQWLGAQATLAELYDELIVSVDGYQVNGAPLANELEIIERMDTYHKVAAAAHLFSPASPEFGEEE